MFKFRMTRLKNSSRKYDGLWFPKAVHTVTVTTEDLLKEIPRSCSLKKSDLLAALTELSEFLLHHLRQGEVVDMDGIGRFKLEVKGQGVFPPTTSTSGQTSPVMSATSLLIPVTARNHCLRISS